MSDSQPTTPTKSNNVSATAERVTDKTPPPDFITFISVPKECHLAKKFILDANGKEVTVNYSSHLYFAHREFPLSSFEDLRDILVQNSMNKRRAAIRGEYFPHSEVAAAEEERKKEVAAIVVGGGKPSNFMDASLFKTFSTLQPDDTTKESYSYLRRQVLLRDTPHHWVCFDIDNYTIPGRVFDLKDTREYIERAITEEIGAEFAISDCIYQLSSSAGVVKPGNKKPGLSAHLWFWMEEPLDGFAWVAWYRRRAELLGRKPVENRAAGRFWRATLSCCSSIPLARLIVDRQTLLTSAKCSCGITTMVRAPNGRANSLGCWTKS